MGILNILGFIGGILIIVGIAGYVIVRFLSGKKSGKNEV